jgi:hypothetical protein
MYFSVAPPEKYVLQVLSALESTSMLAAALATGALTTTAGPGAGPSSETRTATDDFEATSTTTVQPALVAANRGLLQILVSTNWLAQNAPAIADIESAYEQMWARNSPVAALTRGGSVSRDDGLELIGRRTVQDHRVCPVVEFLPDPDHALLG